MTSQEYIRVAQTLPPRLLRFFARYPPVQSSVSSPTIAIPRNDSSIIPPLSNAVETAASTSSLDPNEPLLETSTSLPSDHSSANHITNPFSRTKHPITGNMHDPKFSLRQQADLVKLARSFGIEDLLPPTVKNTETRLQKRIELGVRVKGTGIGQRVKGKAWERLQKNKLQTRRNAMMGMPAMVQKWKQLGHGRGWRSWPK